VPQPANQTIGCSAWSRAQKADAAGSAGSYRGFALLPVALPWPRDLSEAPALGQLLHLAAEAGVRLQALCSPGGQSPHEMVLYFDPAPAGSAFYGYRRLSAPLDPGADPRRWGEVFSFLLEQARTLEPGVRSDEDTMADLLVCTHGRRDACCGSSGTRLVGALRDLDLMAGRVRLWRTSHTGGHRFAPTFYLLPEGSAWAWADLELVRSVLERCGDYQRAADHYRGCAGLGGSRVAALEREVLRQVGWELLGRARRGVDPGGEAPVRLEVAGPPPTGGVWEAAVRALGSVPVPECPMAMPAPATGPRAKVAKADVRFGVSDLKHH